MKKLIIAALGLSLFLVGQGYSSEVKAIEKVIHGFSRAGDANDAVALEQYLDKNYRVVMNRLFGSKDVAVLSRLVYLDKIKSKEFGGDKRELTIKNIVVNGTTASAQVIFKGSKITFISLLTLLKDEKGVWKLVGDVPIVK